MAFVEPITIKEAISKIDSRNFLLPSIQREFVWSSDQIEQLFDSLMKGYPIGSFLFWEVSKDQLKDYQFYDFIRDYHVRDNSHNMKASVFDRDSITAILDGQQRLTSLYIGLKGSYTTKIPGKRWSNNDAFPVKKIYVNLLSFIPETQDYDFRFLSKQEAAYKDDSCHWFLVGDIFSFQEESEINDYIFDKELNLNKNAKFASKTLFTLYKSVFTVSPISFFLEKDTSLDKVLNIFIRVNSGGTKLSYSDLLLSIASAQWNTMDAREEIIKFVDEINYMNFSIDKDFVLKTCLVLCGFKNIAFKVDNFNHENMLKIESKWEDITKAIRGAFSLASSMGYDSSTLPSNIVLIPVAYFLFKKGNPSNYITSSQYALDRERIRKYIIISILKRNFSGQPDNLLRPLRNIIDDHFQEGFPLQNMVEKQRGAIKNFNFDDDTIEALFDYCYGQSYTFSVLSVLYPGLDFTNKFHIDHIFPKTRCNTENKLRKEGVLDSDIGFYLENYNYLANLQLLDGTLNQEKNKALFNEWLDENYPKGSPQRETYLRTNYIPSDIDLSFLNFKEFISRRKQLMSEAFKKQIAIY